MKPSRRKGGSVFLSSCNSLTEWSDQFIKLEDVASRFHKPCILDVKVGRRVWDDFAERDKIERERKKYPQQEILGFRIIGMRVSTRLLLLKFSFLQIRAKNVI